MRIIIPISVYLLWCEQEKKWKGLKHPETPIQVIDIITDIISTINIIPVSI